MATPYYDITDRAYHGSQGHNMPSPTCLLTTTCSTTCPQTCRRVGARQRERATRVRSTPPAYATRARPGDTLDHLDWEAQRGIIRMLVKRVEVKQGQVNVVFRMGPGPLSSGPDPTSLHY